MPFFYEKDLDSFVQHILRERGLNPYETYVKVGIDDGQGKLKFALTLGSKDKPKDEKESVKKVFIIGLAAGVPEKYDNLRKMLNLPSIENVDASFTVDLKLGDVLIAKLLEESLSYEPSYSSVGWS